MREAGTDLFRFMALSGQTADGNCGSRLQLVKIEPQVKRLRWLLATEAVGCGCDRLRRGSRSTYERSDLSQGRAGRASLPAYPTVHSETTLGAIPRARRFLM
jgi:hypothetical protein